MALLGFERGISTLGQQMQFTHELEWVAQAARDNGSSRDVLVRQRIARAWAGLRVMRANALWMLAGAAQAGADGGTALQREALIYKYYWSNWHRDLGQLALDVLGPLANVLDAGETGDGRRTRLQQMALFSRADTIYAGTNEIQLNIIAERGLGMPREARGQS